VTVLASLSLRELIAGVVVLGLLIAGYLALSLTEHDPTGFVTFVVTLAGLAGITGHQVKQTRELRSQSDQLDNQDQRLAKIDHQTNGVLTQRIEAGVRKVLQDAGAIPNDP